jgi:hypothetical protein
VPSEQVFAPNLIFLGTPKSGTTSLYDWLSEHPQIGTGTTKEIRFLMDAAEPLALANGYAKTGLEGYGAYFPRRLHEQKSYWMDVSPTYYYQACAPEAIAALPETPHLGLIFRRPGPRIYSFYQFAMHNKNRLPRGMDFERFVDAIDAGPKGPLKALPSLSNLIDHTDYAKWAELWLQVAPREKISFLTFDQLHSDPRALMQQMCAWLGLDGSVYQDFAFGKENRSFEVKNPALHELKLRAGEWFHLPKGLKRSLRGIYEKMNTRELKREKDARTVELIAELDRRFAPSVARLETLTGLDLSAWRA